MKAYKKIFVKNLKDLGVYIGMVAFAFMPLFFLYLADYYLDLGEWVIILVIPLGVIEAICLVSYMEYKDND